AHEQSGVLPPGSVKAHEEMRQKAQEYAFKPMSLETDTKFVKFSQEQLSQKRDYIEFRIKERGEEVISSRHILPTSSPLPKYKTDNKNSPCRRLHLIHIALPNRFGLVWQSSSKSMALARKREKKGVSG
ncbi:unnamed protein product, partial [marine sediment metagenome]